MTESSSCNGFDVRDADRNALTNNEASDNGIGSLIPRVAGIVGNVLTGNTADNNDQWGILDDTISGTGNTGTDNIYSDNTCGGNGSGRSIPSGLC